MKRLLTGLILSLAITGLLSGCGRGAGGRMESTEQMEESPAIRAQEDAAEEESNGKEARDENVIRIDPVGEITELETGLSAVRYEGDYGFDTFLEQGGADTDTGACLFIRPVRWSERKRAGGFRKYDTGSDSHPSG